MHEKCRNGETGKMALQDWHLKLFKFFGENFEIVKIFNPFYNERVMCIRLRVAPTNPPRSHFALIKIKYTVDFHF